MKLNTLFTLAAAALMLAGCASTPTRIDSGVIHARTYNFVQRRQPVDVGFTDERQPVHEKIQAAISRRLNAAGMTRVMTTGDLTVCYLVIVGNNASTESVSTYFGYGQDVDALHTKAQKAYTSTKNPNYFEAGTLLIDLVDTHTGKILFRNYATRPVIRNIAPEAQSERIQEVVDEILKNLKVQP